MLSCLALLLAGCGDESKDTSADTADTAAPTDTADTGSPSDREPARAFADCSPNDAPAVAFEVGLESAACDAVISGPSVVFILWYTTWDDLVPGPWNVTTTTGMSAWSPTATTGQLVQGTSAVITFETVESAWVTGSYEIHLADDTTRTGSFEGPWCAGSPMCG